MQTDTSLLISHLAKAFDTAGGTVDALSDVSFTAHPGEFICIVGPSGCGKSTLLRLVAGLTEATSGEVSFQARAGGGPRAAMVFQEHGLFPWMPVVDNVAFGLETQGVPTAERRARALEVLDTFGLREFADRLPHQLSIGMRQRVATARAFLVNTPLLLMDEPFGALDAQTRVVLQEELLSLWEQNRQTILYVTHDLDEAILLADRILVMTGRPGRIRSEIPVTLPRPRSLRDSSSPLWSEIKWSIWKMLEHEIRSTLRVRT